MQKNCVFEKNVSHIFKNKLKDMFEKMFKMYINNAQEHCIQNYTSKCISERGYLSSLNLKHVCKIFMMYTTNLNVYEKLDIKACIWKMWNQYKRNVWAVYKNIQYVWKRIDIKTCI